MDNKEFEELLIAPAKERYEFFLKTVVDNEKIWTLSNNKGLATASSDDGSLLISFWPIKEFAQHCATDGWANDTPTSVELSDFMDTWLPGMKQFGHRPSIFPADTDTVLIDIDDLLADLRDELENR